MKKGKGQIIQAKAKSFFPAFSRWKNSCYYLLLSSVLCLNSCDLINPEEALPAYIQVDAPLLTVQPGKGSASAKITEVWIFIDEEFAGAFPIPATVPILKTGITRLRIEAGIRENGLRSTPDIYPFYTPYEQTIELVPNETIRIQPQITYRNTSQIAFIEDFERNGTIFQTLVTGTSTSRMSINKEVPFEGQGSGQIQLSIDDPFVEIATSPKYRDLLSEGNVVYLEMDYQSDVPVSFGILGYNEGQEDPIAFAYQAGFNPSESWNKIYFNLTPVVFTSNAEEFQIVLRAAIPLDENGSFTRQEGLILLDNIKLIH